MEWSIRNTVLQSYLPGETPAPLRYYREQELLNLRGDGTKQLQEWDRVYDYAFYNDLGDPDSGPDNVRPILGGSKDFPYPRRGRTSRPPTKTGSKINPYFTCICQFLLDQSSYSSAKNLDFIRYCFLTDPRTESGMPPLGGLSVYVPRDERFGHVKMSDFLAYTLKALAHGVKPALLGYFDGTEEIDGFKELYNMYEGGLKLPTGVLSQIRKLMPGELLKELFRTDGENFLRLPVPQIIRRTVTSFICFFSFLLLIWSIFHLIVLISQLFGADDKNAWNTDEEFSRETVAGVNPIVIRRLEVISQLKTKIICKAQLI